MKWKVTKCSKKKFTINKFWYIILVSGTFTGNLPLSYYNTLGSNIVEKEEPGDFSDGPIKNPGHVNQLQHFYPLVVKCVMDQDIKVIFINSEILYKGGF